MQQWLSRPKFIAINTFIIFNILAILLGTSSIWTTPFRPLFNPYLHWTRLSQSWVLFGPEPDKVAKRYRVDIDFKDGAKTSWHRPYSPNWDFFERHLAYNFQKHDLSARYLERIDTCRRDFVDYVLRLHHNADNPPVRLTLVRSTAGWPKPTAERDLVYDAEKLTWKDVTIESYVVENGILQ
jgi:hypothetical protein